MPPVLYTADVVCPMTGPPLGGGGVLVDGDVVVAVGSAQLLRGEAARVHHTEGVLLPGLVNGRTRLEHADAEALARSGPAHAWHAALGGLTAGWDAERWSRSAHRGVLAALRGGATAVGDVVTRGPAVPAAAGAGLRGDSWVEVSGADVRHHDSLIERLATTLSLPAGGRRVGLAPVPWLLGTGVLQAVADLARRARAPLHVTAAETQAELAALTTGQGPLADAARARGLECEWLEGGTGLSPVAYLDACGLLQQGSTVAGGVWVGEEDVQLLTSRETCVVCSPRANMLLRAGQAPLERYAEAATPLALGTDSGGINPDQDLLAEAAAWAQLAYARGLVTWPGTAGPVSIEEQAVRLLTADGARALGWQRHVGLLEPGRRADLVGVAVSTTPETVYRDLIRNGPGNIVLSVVAGVRKARRVVGTPWPAIDRDEWRIA